jgi:hypothetical protein
MMRWTYFVGSSNQSVTREDKGEGENFNPSPRWGNIRTVLYNHYALNRKWQLQRKRCERFLILFAKGRNKGALTRLS